MKRRIGHGKLSSGEDDYVPINPRTPDVVNTASVMGMFGSVDQMAGLGWM